MSGLPIYRGQSQATHVYDNAQKKIYTTEMHRHLRAVRGDMAEGRMMIPRRKKV
jgi:hypothetical protein